VDPWGAFLSNYDGLKGRFEPAAARENLASQYPGQATIIFFRLQDRDSSAIWQRTPPSYVAPFVDHESAKASKYNL